MTDAERRAVLLECTRLRCLKLKQDEPSITSPLLATRLGVSGTKVRQWLRAAGLSKGTRGESWL